MKKLPKLIDWPTAWSTMVCNCKVCEGCLKVRSRLQALSDSAKGTRLEWEKRVARILNEAFNNS